jgi:hypothetical protein
MISYNDPGISIFGIDESLLNLGVD